MKEIICTNNKPFPGYHYENNTVRLTPGKIYVLIKETKHSYVVLNDYNQVKFYSKRRFKKEKNKMNEKYQIIKFAYNGFNNLDNNRKSLVKANAYYFVKEGDYDGNVLKLYDLSFNPILDKNGQHVSFGAIRFDFTGQYVTKPSEKLDLVKLRKWLNEQPYVDDQLANFLEEFFKLQVVEREIIEYDVVQKGC